MKKKMAQFMWICMWLVCVVVTANAQPVTFSPVPQEQKTGKVAFASSVTYTLKGETTADADAVALLKSRLKVEKKGQVQLVIGEQGDAAVARYRKEIPQKSEGYYLQVKKDRVVIAGYDAAGTFYGVQSFLQLAAQPQVAEVTVKDWPRMPERGVVEGYYGNPYSHRDRLRLFDFMGANKMNVFIYGPKDDPYHRARWREDYPAEEAARLKELVQRAHANKVQFMWAVHPGGDIRWNRQDSVAIRHKLEAMYALGVRAFNVFFDDIGGEGTRAEKQAGLLNYLTETFVKQHPDVLPLTMCPTQYNRGWSGGDYLSVLGTQLNPDVRMMWTGNSVVDMIGVADMEWINSRIRRKAYIWLNYPVNDYCTDHLLMGPTYGNEAAIDTLVSGFTSNPMEYAEASKVSLYSLADFCWNPAAYEPVSSWQRALEALMPTHAEAFRIFCENNIDLGVTGHGLRREGESPRFVTARDAFLQTHGAEPSVQALQVEFASWIKAAEELLADETQPEMREEIAPWLRVMRLLGQRGQLMLEMQKTLKNADEKAFIEHYLAYRQLEEQQKKVRSRNYPGSIKHPNPVVATNFAVPFLRDQVEQMVQQYKERYTYRLEVFPQNRFEGKYFIRYQGRYLTNAADGGRGGRPVFVAERDTIKPQRQEWFITEDADTKRYKVVSCADQRYLNEVCHFGVNAYSPLWNTYLLEEKEGKFSIRNAGNGGSAFWGMVDGELRPVPAKPEEAFLFELVPEGK